MASVAATPASMQMSIDGNSTICRESSLLKKPHKAVNRPPRRCELYEYHCTNVFCFINDLLQY